MFLPGSVNPEGGVWGSVPDRRLLGSPLQAGGAGGPCQMGQYVEDVGVAPTLSSCWFLWDLLRRWLEPVESSVSLGWCQEEGLGASEEAAASC